MLPSNYQVFYLDLLWFHQLRQYHPQITYTKVLHFEVLLPLCMVYKFFQRQRLVMHASIMINYTIERKMGPHTMFRGQGGSHLTRNDVDFLLVSLDQDF